MKTCKECGYEAQKGFRQGLCNKCYMRQYYIRNREKIIADCHERYIKNIDKKKAYDKKRYKKIPKSQHKKRQKEYSGPCVSCGINDKGIVYVRKMCSSCYKKDAYKKSHKRPKRYCIECSDLLPKYGKLERCYKCNARYKYNNNKEYREMVIRTNDRYKKSEKGIENNRMHNIRRRTLEAKLEFDFTQKDWEEIVEQYDHRCAYCGKRKKLEKDHIIPVNKGGPTTKDNIVPACRKCNASKRDNIWKPNKPYVLV